VRKGKRLSSLPPSAFPGNTGSIEDQPSSPRHPLDTFHLQPPRLYQGMDPLTAQAQDLDDLGDCVPLGPFHLRGDYLTPPISKQGIDTVSRTLLTSSQ
jgi:hypothetical protein